MPLDAAAIQKSDQIAHRFFTKTVLVAEHARNVTNPTTNEEAAAKIDKWFNIETPDTEAYREQLRIYRSLNQLGAANGISPPPLQFRVFLTVPELTANHVLVQHPPNTSRTRVEPTPTHILLENWTLTFRASNSSPSSSPTTASASTSSSSSGDREVSLATVYKHIMSVIRSMFTMLRVLPAWRICKRLRRRAQPTGNGSLGIELRVYTQGDEGIRYLGFGTPLAPLSPALSTTTHTFAQIPHPMGSFVLSVKYLTNPHFEIDTLEALLSSRFLSMDTGPEFTPTLARGSTRDRDSRESASGSPGSLPMRTSLPRSPPQDITRFGTSVADRFVYTTATGEAAGSRASFPGSSPRGRGAALPSVSSVQRSMSAQGPNASASASGYGSRGSGSISSESQSRLSYEGGALGRVRKESSGMGRGSDLPSSPGPGPLSITGRRPSNTTTVNPFKSSTLSSSPSLHSYANSPSTRHASPLPTLPSLTVARPGPAPLGSSTGSRPSFPRAGGAEGEAGPSSPVSAYRTGNSPIPPLRPSPPSPFVPSSLGDKRFPTILSASPAEGAEPIATPPRRKRYSSSFGYRHAGGASEGSAGSGERGASAGSGEKGKEVERERPSPSLLSIPVNAVEDDDISAFMQEIDARKPLGGLSSSPQSAHPSSSLSAGFPFPLRNVHERERTLSEAGLAGRAFLAGAKSSSSFGTETSARPSFVSRVSGDNGGSGTGRHHRTSSDSFGIGAGNVGSDFGLTSRGQPPSLSSSPGLPERDPLRSRTYPQIDMASSAGNGRESAIDSRLREMTDAFQASMGRVERRPSTVIETSEHSSSPSSSRTSSTSTSTAERQRIPSLGPSPFPPYNPGPGAAHLRTPSYSAATGVPNLRPTSISGLSSRRVASTSTSTHPPTQEFQQQRDPPSTSIWDNRRPRTDSAGSASSSNVNAGTGLGDRMERERSRIGVGSVYGYGQNAGARDSRGSVGGPGDVSGTTSATGSLGSEEVVGRMDMDR